MLNTLCTNLKFDNMFVFDILYSILDFEHIHMCLLFEFRYCVKIPLRSLVLCVRPRFLILYVRLRSLVLCARLWKCALYVGLRISILCSCSIAGNLCSSLIVDTVCSHIFDRWYFVVDLYDCVFDLWYLMEFVSNMQLLAPDSFMCWKCIPF